MSGMSACCVSGYVHEGTPKGTFEQINGINTYVALPEGDYDKTKAFLILTDVFGVELPNGKLQADAYAAKVPIPVYMPDYLLGDPLALSDLSLPAEEKTKKIGDWLSRHNKDVTQPAVDKIIEGLKQKGIKEIAAIGYCFGGRYVVDLCISSPPVISAGVVAHPSRLNVPEDLHALNASPVDFLWLHMLKDNGFTKEQQDLAREITKDNKKHVHADFDAGHGAAIRCDLNNPDERKAADGAFDRTVAWLKERFITK